MSIIRTLGRRPSHMTEHDLDIKEPLLRQLFAYWNDKRGTRRLPSRKDISPAEIPKLLPHLMMVDVAETLGDFRYRLFGTSVCQGFGWDRTGVRFAELPNIENYEEVYEGYWQTYDQAIPVYFPGRIVSKEMHFISYSRLTLPLSSDDKVVDQILGGCVFFETGKRGSWL